MLVEFGVRSFAILRIRFERRLLVLLKAFVYFKLVAYQLTALLL